jgi:Fe2+ or Zn2+ uptake regulation protein
LKANSYRLTRARIAVVEAVTSTQSALSPLEVFEYAKTIYPGLGLVSVYRTLETLEELGLIQRMHQHEGWNAYIPHADGHQYLIICDEGGKAEYFEGDDMDAFFSSVAGEHGFTVREHWLQLFGICSGCES